MALSAFNEIGMRGDRWDKPHCVAAYGYPSDLDDMASKIEGWLDEVVGVGRWAWNYMDWAIMVFFYTAEESIAFKLRFNDELDLTTVT